MLVTPALHRTDLKPMRTINIGILNRFAAFPLQINRIRCPEGLSKTNNKNVQPTVVDGQTQTSFLHSPDLLWHV